MNTIDQIIHSLGIVPVIKIDSPNHAHPLAQSLIDGGLPIAEITFRTEAAEESLRLISNRFPQILIGGGTILSIDQAQRAINAGAQFLVSPGFDEDLVDFAQRNSIPYFPGVNNPTEIQRALKKGLTTLKFFPAEPSGGISMLNALSAPFPQVSFMPTGGIGPENLHRYLQHTSVLAVGGSWMVPAKFLETGNWPIIRSLCADAVALKNKPGLPDKRPQG